MLKTAFEDAKIVMIPDCNMSCDHVFTEIRISLIEASLV